MNFSCGQIVIYLCQYVWWWNLRSWILMKLVLDWNYDEMRITILLLLWFICRLCEFWILRNKFRNMYYFWIIVLRVCVPECCFSICTKCHKHSNYAKIVPSVVLCRALMPRTLATYMYNCTSNTHYSMEETIPGVARCSSVQFSVTVRFVWCC
jgi:hypothetical protein